MGHVARLKDRPHQHDTNERNNVATLRPPVKEHCQEEATGADAANNL